MMGRPSHATRRTWLRRAIIGFAFAPGWIATLPARAREKMTKQEAEYQDSPKDIRMCGTCTLFDAPKSCKVVEGDVSPQGWCKVFAMAD